jgi:hypothetical protein
MSSGTSIGSAKRGMLGSAQRGTLGTAFLKALATLAVMIGGAGLGLPNALAHEGKGVIVVISAEPGAELVVRYTVSVTFESDGHPAAEATVTVVGEKADGSKIGPVALAPSGVAGQYSGEVVFSSPGEWVMRVSSLGPDGVLEQPITITAPLTPEATTEATTTTITMPTSTTTAAAVTMEVAPAGESKMSTTTVLLIAVGAAVLVGGAVFVARKPK